MSETPELVLFGLPPSSYVRTALMVCENKGVKVRLQPVDFRAPEYRAHHPFARMPALQHGDVALYEALAIAAYVDEAFDGPSLQPTAPADRARMFQWISATNDYLYDSVVGACVAERFVKPMRGIPPDEEVIAAAMPAITNAIDVIDAALASGPYICGAQLTLADLFLAPVLHYFAATPEGKALLPERANIGAWLTRMEATPNFHKVNFLG